MGFFLLIANYVDILQRSSQCRGKFENSAKDLMSINNYKSFNGVQTTDIPYTPNIYKKCLALFSLHTNKRSLQNLWAQDN